LRGLDKGTELLSSCYLSAWNFQFFMQQSR
jgi:hypothetical protein